MGRAAAEDPVNNTVDYYGNSCFYGQGMRISVDDKLMKKHGSAANALSGIFDWPTTSAFEQERLLLDWNRTETDFPCDASIDQLFEEQAIQRPEAIALEHNGNRWTYQELNQRSNQIANLLRRAGAQSETLIGICLERSADMIIGMLAILKAGSAYVPIDPGYPAERRSLMLEGCRLLVTAKNLAAEFAGGEPRVICVEDAGVLGLSGENVPSSSNGENLAYVIYTSGSTGRPKGVEVMHRGVIRLVRNTNFLEIEQCDVVAQAMNVCFDASIAEIWGALLNGARLVILDRETMLSPSALQQDLEQRGITVLTLVRAQFNIMAREAPGAFKNLKYVVFGGEPADPRSVAAVLKHGPPRHLLNVYGPTEATVAATCMDIREVAPGAISIPIGRPISNTTIHLLDGRGNLVPLGAVGEIYIGGAGVARGYLGEPILTAQRFIDNRFSNEQGARLYKTGDLARWRPDGTLDLVGRIDAQVKIRGFRVEPVEIEDALKEHPAANDATVMLREDRSGEKRLVAYAAGDPARLNPTELRYLLKAKLPAYMLPSAIVVLEKFPLNPNGKIDHRALPEPIAARGDQSFVGPRDTLEAQLAAIWEGVLAMEPIGVTDDFFEIGGDSLLAARIFAEVERSLGKHLPLATLFRMPTIEKFAAALQDQGWKPTWTPIVAIQSHGSRPPFFCVHGGFGGVLFYGQLARCLGTEQPLYGLQAEGLDNGPIQHTSIQSMAEYYIEEMRGVQPRGPYSFGGYSFGGIVAFEMAQQLRAKGEEVALVVLFDTLDPRIWPVRISPAARIRSWLQVKELWSRVRQFGDLLPRVRRKLGVILAKGRMDARSLLDKAKQLNGGSSITRDRALRLVQLANRRALSAYELHPYPGRLTLFRAEDPDNGSTLGTDSGWTQFAKGGIQIHKIPGEHQKIFAQPNVQTLAAKLDACLRNS